MRNTHYYRNRDIRPCVSAERGEGTAHQGRWYIQTFHPQTGMPYSDESCPHVRTLAEAREAIDQQLAVEAQA